MTSPSFRYELPQILANAFANSFANSLVKRITSNFAKTFAKWPINSLAGSLVERPESRFASSVTKCFADSFLVRLDNQLVKRLLNRFETRYDKRVAIRSALLAMTFDNYCGSSNYDYRICKLSANRLFNHMADRVSR